MRVLAWAAARGRNLLILGVVIGILIPPLAEAMAPTIVPFLAVLLVLAAVREGPRAAVSREGGLGPAIAATLLIQALPPLLAGAVLAALGLLSNPLAVAAVLALGAAPITGAPGLAAMTGADVGAALRQVALGTALLPLTAAPVFALLPVFPDPLAVAAGALRLLALVAAAGLVAAVLRRVRPALAEPTARPALDGGIALAMSAVVIGLMSEVGPALLATPGRVALVLCIAILLYLLQTVAALRFSRAVFPEGEAMALAIAAGNRNLALFLAAVPPETAAPLMLFVGLYQIPMYLTPAILPRLVRGPARA